MSTFMLETSDVESAASSLKQVSSNISNISSSVSGYDTTCEDGFDFASAKNVIASNIEACSIKVTNTANLLTAVVEAHTDVQNKLANSGNNNSNTNSNTGGNNKNRGTSSNTSSNRTYSGGYSSGGSSYSSGGGYSASIPVATTTINKPKEEKKKEEQTKEKEDKKVVTVNANLSKVGYACVDFSKLSEESKKVMEDGNLKYDKNGYAKIKNRYIVAVDSSIGKVGDVLRFTQKDGTIIEAIIGVATINQNNKNNISFIVSSYQQSNFVASDFSKKLLENNEKIENYGNYTEAKTTTISNEAIKTA